MPNFGSVQDFLALWPLWLVLGGCALFVLFTRDREPRRGPDAFGQQMQDQRRVHSLFNIGAMFGRRD